MTEGAPLTDEPARRAASAPQASVLLEAPAGSGKTAVLTERFLRLLCTVQDPGEILAITFTRKAAAEMRARVIRALRGELAPTDAASGQLQAHAAAAIAHGAALGWDLAGCPQNLRIQTIDAFNYALACQLPVASRVGGTLNVTETPRELYARAARHTLLYAEGDALLAPDLQRLFERCDNHWMNLERLIAQLLRERAHWLRFVAGEAPHVLTARVNASLAALVAAHLRALHTLLPPPLRERAEALPGVGALAPDAGALGAWRQLVQLTLTTEDWRRQLGPHLLGAAFADATRREALRALIAALRDVPHLREALLELRRLPAACLPAEEAAALESLARVLAHAAAQLQAQFALAQRVDYTYITGAARQALAEEGEPTELALRTGLALRHILVDEFQDTSLAQFELLATLTAGWEPGDGRTLFVVGDPMQSIYRFRDAEVGLFLRARAGGVGALALTPLRLRRNFRTVPELIDFNNALFAAIFPASDDLRAGAVAYTPSLAARSAQAPPAGIDAVTLRLFAGGAAAEAAALAARIAALRERDPQGSVAVLVAAHAHAVPVIAALEARALAVLGVDLVPLRERPVVRDLVALTRALLDLGDRAAWLAVLRAPWCGARLASLTALSGPEDPQLVLEALAEPERLRRCAPADRTALARVRATLEEALGHSRASLAEWLEATWIRLGAPDAYAAEELEDARAFFAALAARAASGEWVALPDFDALLENLYSTRAASGAHAVQVMTIHRAKGLEFEHVFVPALDRLTRLAERPLLRWIDLPGEAGTNELLIAPATPVGPKEERGLEAYIAELLRRRESEERKRLLYVALTRARTTLWLSGAPGAGAGDSIRPARHSLLGALWPALSERFVIEAGEPPPERVGPRRVTRLRAAWEPPALPPGLALRHLPAAHLRSEPPEFSWVGETQRHVGT
ncbi:MAG TPA: UvrD-helicase domain-containing protein, partial [Steroidobacteraceae bacterium]|nr:UvrD-helicase domain-containing protein [Steroidobacteraceae bacterium]